MAAMATGTRARQTGRVRQRGVAASRPRNADATKRRLVEAVGAILARDGFAKLGVSAIAHEARTDKVLIYRYFGGLPQLFEAYAESTNFWPTVEEMAGGTLEELMMLPLEARVERAVGSYIRQIRARPLTQEILAWELSERNEVTSRLEGVRERRGLALMKALAHDLPAEVDLPSIAGVLAGAVHYLLLRARKIRVFNGIDLRADEGWTRIEAAARSMIIGAIDRATR
jgi:AcrR family transcriptional regulator